VTLTGLLFHDLKHRILPGTTFNPSFLAKLCNQTNLLKSPNPRERVEALITLETVINKKHSFHVTANESKY
jgi:hypothetical protein